MSGTSTTSGIMRRWWIVVGLAVLGAIIGALPAPEQVQEQTTTYSATNIMLASETRDQSAISTEQIQLLATVGDVPARVGEELGLDDSPAAIASEVEVIYEFPTGALRVTTQQPTAEEAETLVDTYAATINSFLVQRQTELYQQQLAAARQQRATLEAELNEKTLAAASNPDDPALAAERDAISRQYGLAFEEERRAEEQESTPLTFTTLQAGQAVPITDSDESTPASRRTRGVMGFIAGGVLGVAIAFVLTLLDRKVRSREQVEELMDMRARVMIPQVRKTEGGVVVTEGRHDPLSDAYRTVRNVVGFVQSKLPPSDRARVTLVVSPGPGDGKTSLSANLSAAFLETGQRTIAVNADFRRPRLSTAITGVTPVPLPYQYIDLPEVGTRELLADTKRDNLKILDLATIEAAPGELVRATIPHIEALSEVSDEIVVDTSPVGATAEVLDLIPFADVIVVTAKVGHTSTRAIERTIAILRDIAAAPLVLVLGGTRTERNPYYEYTSRTRSPSSRSRLSLDRFRRSDRSSPNGEVPASSTPDPDEVSETELQTSE